MANCVSSSKRTSSVSKPLPASRRKMPFHIRTPLRSIPMPVEYAKRWSPWFAVIAGLVFFVSPSLTRSQPKPAGDTPPAPNTSSYDQIAPVLLGKETFQDVLAKDKADKDAVMARQSKLLQERYDLTARPDAKLTMTRGKPIQVDPTARLPQGMTFEKLAAMSTDELRANEQFPKVYLH